MLETSHGVAEGWYADPGGRLLMRYWNGNDWTLETRGNDAWAAPDEQQLSQPAVGRPETGWAGVAFALHSALLSKQPATVTITLPTQSVVTVNTFNHTYTWGGETAQLPPLISQASITFAPGNISEGQQGRSLDGLLWRISAKAFPDRLAPWLQSDDLYRMQRWPNLTTINPELDDMRQAAMLANGMFTVDELAGFSDRSFGATRALVNALSLMNTLKVATPRDTGVFSQQQGFGAPQSFGGQPAFAGTTPQPSFGQQPAQQGAPAEQYAQAAQKPGLFQRLRARLGL